MRYVVMTSLVEELTRRLSERALCSKMLVISVTVLLGFPISTGRGAMCPFPPLAAGSNLVLSSLTCEAKAMRGEHTCNKHTMQEQCASDLHLLCE